MSCPSDNAFTKTTPTLMFLRLPSRLPKLIKINQKRKGLSWLGFRGFGACLLMCITWDPSWGWVSWQRTGWGTTLLASWLRRRGELGGAQGCDPSRQGVSIPPTRHCLLKTSFLSFIAVSGNARGWLISSWSWFISFVNLSRDTRSSQLTSFENSANSPKFV